MKKRDYIDAGTAEIFKEHLPDGSLKVSFKDQGDPCLAIILTDPRPKVLGETQLIIKDLELTLASIDAGLQILAAMNAKAVDDTLINFSFSRRAPCAVLEQLRCGYHNLRKVLR